MSHRQVADTRRHARRRAKERLGIRLTRKVERHIISMIRAGKSVIGKRTSATRVIHSVNMAGMMIKVVYSSASKQIITVLSNRPLVSEI